MSSPDEIDLLLGTLLQAIEEFRTSRTEGRPRHLQAQALSKAGKLYSALRDRFWDRSHNCLECGQDCADAYMVRDEIWARAVPNEGELRQKRLDAGLPRQVLVLHLACLEKRIGRPIGLGDLTEAPINSLARHLLCQPR